MDRKRPRKTLPKKLDGAQDAHLLALTCSPPPEGYNRWMLRLLAGRIVELEHVESLSYETVCRTLKKARANLAKPRMVYSTKGELRICGLYGERFGSLS
jgi:hypothetical protein